MARMSVFSSPLLLGFEHIEQMIDRANKSSAEGYPPYNIEQIGQNALRITLAVAGFSENDLVVTVEDNQLYIRGKSPGSSRERVYLHRGIASRNFTRSFVLAEDNLKLYNELVEEDGTIKTKKDDFEIRNIYESF